MKIATDKAAAHQARSYAWSAQLPIVVLTNFAEVAIYNGLVRPKVNDTGVDPGEFAYSTVVGSPRSPS